jgi:hypothetical protein
MPKRKIKGKIIRILDKRSVIINLGKEHGINESSLFFILGKPEHVIDPFSNEELGYVTVAIARVKASQVFDKFTIATTSWTEMKETWFTRWLGGSKTIDEGELAVKEEEIKPWDAKSQSAMIAIGDEVEVEIDEHEHEQASLVPEQTEETERAEKEVAQTNSDEEVATGGTEISDEV